MDFIWYFYQFKFYWVSGMVWVRCRRVTFLWMFGVMTENFRMDFEAVFFISLGRHTAWDWRPHCQCFGAQLKPSTLTLLCPTWVLTYMCALPHSICAMPPYMGDEILYIYIVSYLTLIYWLYGSCFFLIWGKTWLTLFLIPRVSRDASLRRRCIGIHRGAWEALGAKGWYSLGLRQPF